MEQAQCAERMGLNPHNLLRGVGRMHPGKIGRPSDLPEDALGVVCSWIRRSVTKEVPMEGLLVVTTLTLLRILLPVGLLLLLGTLAERGQTRSLRSQ
jgi:hypothetical protein